MISYLKGRVLLKDSDYIILETNQIGYKVHVPEVLYTQLREGQEGVEMFCSLQIRKEETIELYGLPSFEALKLFEAFRDVSGIGPKAAMLLSSLGEPEKIKKAVNDRNIAFFGGVKGIGEKKVQKLILELTGKLGSLDNNSKRSSGDEVVDSLANLGFSKTEAKDALAQLPADITDPEQKIKAALKLLGHR
jgi:holliday junction DNA helicase RuvA